MTKDAIETSLFLEHTLDIDAFDGRKIWVACNRANPDPSAKAVLLCHGLTGQPNEYIHMMARDYFTARGYDVYRLAFYWDGPQYRSLKDCTLDIHGRDINSVLSHMKKIHAQTYICGHSYGGASLLFANPQTDALAFWDASFHSWERMWQNSIAPLEDGNFTLNWNVAAVIGRAMVDEARATFPVEAAKKAAAIRAPALVVEAGAGSMQRDCRDLFNNLAEPKEFHSVPGAGHCFVEGLTVFDLLETTQRWFTHFPARPL